MNRIKIFVLVGLGLLLFTLPLNAEPLLECEFPENQHLFDRGPFLVQPRVGQEYVLMTPSDAWEVVDVGAVYTEKQADKMGATVAPELQREHVAGSNTAATVSNMKVVFRLVGQKLIPSNQYTESGSTMQDLINMANSDSSDTGPFAGLRDQWGADILMLSVSSGGGFGGGPYAVIGNSSTKTAAHELGHCLGMNHSIEDTSIVCDPDDQLCLRSRGYVWFNQIGQRLCDVLGSGCEMNTERLLRYANPGVLYQGLPTGLAGVAEAAVIGEIIAERDVQDSKPPNASSVCIPDATTLCLRQGRFLVKAYVKRPTVEGHASMTQTASNAGTFTLGNLAPVQVKLTCTATKKVVVAVTGSVPKAVMTSVLVLDTKTGQHLSVIKKAKAAYKPNTLTTTLSCN
ncbi:MAG: hypothetical protein KBD16_01440 [Candidatus Pacebacteria bacterium]|nr:hypothetical protein [Candidatus Paceibacterota bacterium]